MVVASLLIAAGVFSIAGAVADWDWFMNATRARAVVGLLGRDGARVFYGLLGSVITAIGVSSAWSALQAW